MSLVTKLKFVCKPHDIQARVHGRDINAKCLNQNQNQINAEFWYLTNLAKHEICPAQLIHITKVYEHVTGTLGPAGDVHTSCYHVGALPPPGQVFGQGKFEEVECHVNVVWAEA